MKKILIPLGASLVCCAVLVFIALAFGGTFTITYDAIEGQAFVDACAAGYCGGDSYSATITDPADPESTIPNPVSEIQFAKKKLRRWMIGCVVAHQAALRAKSERLQAIADAEAEMDGITVE